LRAYRFFLVAVAYAGTQGEQKMREVRDIPLKTVLGLRL